MSETTTPRTDQEWVREAIELSELFDLQQTRMERARALWQAATGNDHTWPDLGKLLDWLLGHIDVDSVARELHETKGGGPFGRVGECECELDIRRLMQDQS